MKLHSEDCVDFLTESSGESAAIAKAMLGFIRALVAEKELGAAAAAENARRVSAWLERTEADDAATQTPPRPPAPRGQLRRRPVPVTLPSGRVGASPEQGILTPERDAAIAMRAAAIATDGHTPRTAALRLAAFESLVRERAPTAKRVAQAAHQQDADAVLEKASESASIAAIASAARMTPNTANALQDSARRRQDATPATANIATLLAEAAPSRAEQCL